jgi:hypothetical protein
MQTTNTHPARQRTLLNDVCRVANSKTVQPSVRKVKPRLPTVELPADRDRLERSLELQGTAGEGKSWGSRYVLRTQSSGTKTALEFASSPTTCFRYLPALQDPFQTL